MENRESLPIPAGIADKGGMHLSYEELLTLQKILKRFEALGEVENLEDDEQDILSDITMYVAHEIEYLRDVEYTDDDDEDDVDDDEDWEDDDDE